MKLKVIGFDKNNLCQVLVKCLTPCKIMAGLVFEIPGINKVAPHVWTDAGIPQQFHPYGDNIQRQVDDVFALRFSPGIIPYGQYQNCTSWPADGVEIEL